MQNTMYLSRRFRIVLHFIICNFLTFALADASLCGAERAWVNRGPFNAAIVSLAIDPHTPQTMYAGAYNGGVYKSIDGGNRWKALNIGNSGVLTVGVLAIDPDAPQTLFAGTESGLFKSTDGGNSWNYILKMCNGGALTMDPSAPHTMYAAPNCVVMSSMNGDAGDLNNYGLYKSIDGGNSWNRIGLNDVGINALAIDPQNPQTIYAGTYNGIYKSTDGGNSWTLVGWVSKIINCLAIDPSTPQTIYAGIHDYGVYKSTDGGNTLSAVNTGLSGLEVLALVIDPSTQTIYAGAYISQSAAGGGGVYQSINGGSVWTPTGLTGYPISALVIDPSAPQKIYAGSSTRYVFGFQTLDGQIFRSADAGKSWQTATQGPVNDLIYQLIVDPKDPQIKYAAAERNGVIKSTDGGNSWTAVSQGLVLPIKLLAIDPITPQTIYVGSESGVFKSTDGGAHWPSRTLMGYWIRSLAIDPLTPQTIYAGTKDELFKSTDGGNSWNPIGAGLGLTGVTLLAVDPLAPQTIYAAGFSHNPPVIDSYGIYKSTNGGNSWSMSGIFPTLLSCMAIDPITPRIIYASTGAQLFKSSNGGNSWNEIHTGIPDLEVYSLLIDPLAPQNIYIGNYPGIYRSTDGGSRWTAMNPGIRSYAVQALAVDSTIPRRLYAGTLGGGIWTYSLAPGISQYDISLADGGAAAVTTPGISRGAQTGYSKLEDPADANPFGTAVFIYKQGGVTTSEAGVPASPPTTHARVFIDYRSDVPGVPSLPDSGRVHINTGIGVVNCGSDFAHIAYTLMNANGSVLSTGQGILAAGNHFAKFIDQLNEVASGFVLPPNFQFASLDIVSDQPLSVLGLRMTTNQRGEPLFTTTPVADGNMPDSNASLYFPQLADGSGWTTSIVLLNLSASVEKGVLNITDNNGLPFVVHQAGGEAASSFPYSIPPGGLFRFQTDGSSESQTAGWARVIPDSMNVAPAGSGLFAYNPAGALVAESGIPSILPTTHARIYVDLTENHNTGLAISNPDAVAADVAIRAFRTNGVTPAGESQDSLQLAGFGHDAKFADQLISGLPANFTGILDISSPARFAAITVRSLYNERNDFLVTTFPFADATRPAPSPIVFPQIVDGGGYATQFILIGPEEETSVRLELYDETGALLDLESQ